MKTQKDYYDTSYGIFIVALEKLKYLLFSFLMVTLAIVFAWMLCFVAEAKEPEKVVEFAKDPDIPQEITIDELRPELEYVIDMQVEEIGEFYDLDSDFIRSIIWHESRYDPDAKSSNGKCVGLMQINEYWHKDRMKRLGVNDLQDVYSNILVGCDYISELFDKYQDPYLVLMLYNMPHDKAMQKFKQGEISYYAKSVMSLTKYLKEGGSLGIS